MWRVLYVHTYVHRYDSSDVELVSSDVSVESSLVQNIHINISTYVNTIVQLVSHSTSEEHEDKEDSAAQMHFGSDHECSDGEASDEYSKDSPLRIKGTKYFKFSKNIKGIKALLLSRK